MCNLYFRGDHIATFSNPTIAAAFAIARFRTGHLLRGDVQIHMKGI